MSDILKEQASWRKGKTPVITKYILDHTKLFAEIAGRGFLALPGYAYEAETGIELFAKMGLSELNYKIIAETIEAELKATGFAYDTDYKNAAIAWEIRKQALMAAWDAEFAGIKQGMASQEEILNQLMNEVNQRQVILLEGKTSLELQMEAYRRQMAQLSGTTAPYEVQLANAKMLTAQKKLEIIPILEEILGKEQDLLTVEQQKSSAYTLLIAAERENVGKEALLIPGLQELANLTLAYANLIPGQITIEHQIANEKARQATAVSEKAGYQIDEINKEITAEETKLELVGAHRELEGERFDNDMNVSSRAISDESTLETTMMNNFNTIHGQEMVMQAKLILDKTSVNTNENQAKLATVTTINTAEIASDIAVSNDAIYERRGVADAAASATITAELTHLIA
jgi:hypothetical protein